MSLDVARAFAFHSYVTGDREYLRAKCWPMLSGVANWILSRVDKTYRGYEIKAAMGIAEREGEADNAAFTNMAAVVVLRDAINTAEALGRTANPDWAEAAAQIVLPKSGPVIISHDGFKPKEEKGGTPDPLMGIYPPGFDMGKESEAATLKFYLGLRRGYIGSPMLSALYGIWAAYVGDRRLSAQLMDEGYGQWPCAIPRARRSGQMKWHPSIKLLACDSPAIDGGIGEVTFTRSRSITVIDDGRLTVSVIADSTNGEGADRCGRR